VIEVRQTSVFSEWLAGLRDLRGRSVIARRIARMAQGNFGDAKSVGDRVSELKIDFGPGYRVYYTRQGQVVILLCGGDKDDQRGDVAMAQAMAVEVHDGN
jgi:putative addiction module killer protein